MAADTRPIDPLGRPDIVYDRGHGLGTLTRRFKVKGKYSTGAQLPSNIKRAFEAPDFEHTDFLLAEQSIDGTESQDGETSILREIYIQVPADAATEVQIGQNVVIYGENGLKLVEQRKFVKRTHTLAGTVGTTVGDSGDIDQLYLSDNRFSERGKVAAVVVKRWSEQGVLNYTNKLRYGSLLNEHIITTIGDLSLEAAKLAVGIDGETTASLDVEIGQYEGFRTRVYRLYSGQGIISTSVTTRYNGVLTITTIVALNQIPVHSGVLTDARVEDRGEGQVIYTYTFVEGSGVFSTSERTKHNGALTLTTIRAINLEPTHSGALVNTNVDEGDGYTIYTYTFASGQGEVSRSTTSKYGGVLSFETVVSINETPTGTGAAFKTDVQEGDGYLIYTYTFVSGSGVISTDVKTRHNGALALTTITAVDVVPTGAGVVISSGSDQRDGYIIYTRTFAEGSGVIDTNTKTRYNGALTLTTVRAINTTPTGSGALINQSVTEADGYTLYTYEFAEGAGEIDRSISTRYNGALTLTTITSLDVAPSASGALVSSKTQQGDGYIIYTRTFAEGSGEISRSVTTKQGGALTITTITSLDVAPSSSGVLFDTKTQQGDGYIIYTYTFASGSGVVRTDIDSRSDGSEIITKVAINTDPSSATGYLISTSEEERDGYVVRTFRWYSPPNSYTVPVSQLVQMPAQIILTNTLGPHIDPVNPGGWRSLTGSAEVTFTTSPPAALAISDSLKPVCVAQENVTYDDGQKLYRNTIFRNSWGSATLSLINGTYMGKATTSGAVTLSGGTNPAGNILVGFKVDPYFSVSGTTIYKVTKTTLTI